jgi:hypothetical protein
MGLSSFLGMATLALLSLLSEGCALIAGLEERHGMDGPVEIVSGQDLPRSLALDETHVYWATESKLEPERAVRRVAKEGGDGDVTDIALTGVRTPLALAVDVTHVYWGDVPEKCAVDEEGDRIARALKSSSGDAPEELWKNCHHNERMGLAQDSARVYFTQWSWSTVSELDKGTAQAQELANNQEQPVSIAVDSEAIYWTSYDKDRDDFDDVRRRPKDGGNFERFAHTPGGPTFLAVDETDVFWVTDSGSIYKQAKDAPEGTEPTELASGLDTPGGIALDTRYAYVTDSGAGTVLRVKKDGSGEVEEIASSQSYPAGVAVDSASVYWTNFSGGQVMKLAKP